MLLKEAYYSAAKLLKLQDCNNKLEARLLIQHVLKIDEVYFLVNQDIKINKIKFNKLIKLIEKRNTGYPLEYILGYKYFWKHKFLVNNNVLIPRADTETLVEGVLTDYKNIKRNINILDIGVGSGCILLSLLKEIENAKGVGVDISKKALIIAKKNISNLDINNNRVALLQQNMFSALKPINYFDIIVSNPPYIAYKDTLIDNNVKKFEPHKALFAKNKGMFFYKEILRNADKYLNNLGILYLEIGVKQKEEILNISKISNLKFKESLKDYNNIDRVLVFKK